MKRRIVFERSPQIIVDSQPSGIAINGITNKIYVSNLKSGTVSVIDSNSGNGVKSIRVGAAPSAIAADSFHNKIYVANEDSNTVSVIDGYNDTEIGVILVGKGPNNIVINEKTSKIYVSNNYSGSVSVIDGSKDEKEPNDITVGKGPSALAVDYYKNKIYVSNNGNDTVSVISADNDTKIKDINVGRLPTEIVVNRVVDMIYVVNQGSNSVSVIDPSSDRVAAGVTFNISPANSGKIICSDNKEYPTNYYLFVATGTNCTAQANRDFVYTRWVENLNRNSTSPLSDNSATLTVNRYGTFTANFKPLPPAIPPEYWTPLYGIIVSSIVGWSIPSIIGWLRGKTQRKYLKKCLNQIGKLDKNKAEEEITRLYVQGKINDSHHKLLKDKIAEYYDNSSGSSGSPIK